MLRQWKGKGGLVDSASGDGITTIGTWPPDQLARRIARESTSRVRNGAALAKAALAFHSDLKCTNRHTAGLVSKLAVDDTILVRLAHQPNLFPYKQILAQTVYLSLLGSCVAISDEDVVPVVFLVDYDVCGDQWIRTSKVVDSRVKGQVRSFEHNLSALAKAIPAHLCPGPNVRDRERIAGDLEAYAIGQGRSGAYLIENSGVFRNCRSLADFDAFAWVNLAIEIWELPILFLRLSDLAPTVEYERKHLATLISGVTSRPSEEYLWRVCPTCSRRIEYQALCCGRASSDDRSLPKVLADDLGDYVTFGVNGGTVYESGRQHLVEAHRIAAKLGIGVPSEACWRLGPGALGAIREYDGVTAPHARALITGARTSLMEDLLDRETALSLKKSLEHAARAVGSEMADWLRMFCNPADLSKWIPTNRKPAPWHAPRFYITFISGPSGTAGIARNPSFRRIFRFPQSDH